MKKKIKILYFTGSQREADVRELLQENFPEIVLRISASFEKVKEKVACFRPHIILVDHLVNFFISEVDLRIIKNVSKCSLILLTDLEAENSAIKYLKYGLEDYVFLDRPQRLSSLIEKLISESAFPKKRNSKGKSIGSEISDTAEEVYGKTETQEINNCIFFQDNPLPAWIIDKDTLEILDANLAAIQPYSYTKEEFLSMDIRDLFRPEDLPRLLNISAKSGRGQEEFAVQLSKKQGKKASLRISTYAINYNNRQCTLMIGLDVTEKERALRELKVTTGKLKVAQQTAELGYWEKEIEKGGLFWSDEVYKIWGREKNDFKPSLDAFFESIHPDDKEKYQQEIDKMLKNPEEELDFEHRILVDNGKVKWVHEKGRLNRNSDGKLIFGGTVQDITNRKSFDEKLILSEARNRAVLKSQTNYLIRVNLEGKYSYCNDKFIADFGWIFPQDQLVGKPAYSSVMEYHYDRVKKLFEDCCAAPNRTIQAEIDKLTEDGEAKTTLWDFVCLTDVQGGLLEIQGVGIDITDRVKAEKALRESNQRYELASKATSDAIYDWNIASGKISWNSTYCELFGYDWECLNSNIHIWKQHIHPEDRHILEGLDQAIESGAESWNSEYRYKKADGDYAHVNERGTIIRDLAGKAVRMVGAIQDITTNKLALEKLLVSESRHRGLIQSQTNYMIRTDYKGNYNYCNEKFVEEFGWIHGGENLIGQSSIISIMDYHHSRIERMVYECMEKPGEVFQIELDKPGKNGRTKTTLWDMIYLAASTPEESEIQCVGIDITDRVEAEAQMRFQADLLDKIGQAVIARDISGKIIYWNKAATEIYGWSKEEAIGEDIREIIPTSRTAEEQEEVNKILEEGFSSSEEFTVMGKNGNKFPVLVIDSPFIDEKGILKGVVSISSDISERKKNETELQNYTMELIRANKGLEQFSFIVSHNLRAPLANLLGLADLLNEDFPQETKERLMQELLGNIKRLDDVVNDLNSILRVKTEVNENKQRINLQELVSSIVSSVDHTIKKEQVEIITDFSTQPEFTAVKSYLHSILYNLISNSIKYRKPDVKPIIRISSQIEADSFLIIIEDNGLGMDLKNKADQIFGLYKRYHTHVEGKGMGLFMVKTQVETLGGKINVESKQNKGSKFILKFKMRLQQL